MKRSQIGMLLETFILFLIIILFTLFWGNMSKNAFVAGLFKIDDRALNHSCSSMASVILGTDYIMNTEKPDKDLGLIIQNFYDYLGYIKSVPIPDAKYFYMRAINYFPELKDKIGIRINVIKGKLPDDFIYAYPETAKVGNMNILSFLSRTFSITKCSFPLYSVNESFEATMDLIVYI